MNNFAFTDHRLVTLSIIEEFTEHSLAAAFQTGVAVANLLIFCGIRRRFCSVPANKAHFLCDQ